MSTIANTGSSRTRQPSVRSRKRILFIAEAVTLAHVARLVALANALPADRYDVTLLTDPRYNHLLGNLSYRVEKIDTIPGSRFLKALQSGRPIYDWRTLKGYVEQDLRLLTAYLPDVVIGDFRLSLDVSARLAQVPYGTVANAYWSPYAKIGYPVPELHITKIVGVRTAQRIFDLVRPFAFRLHARPMNRVRKWYGLEPLEPDLRLTYTHADYTLYADLPELVPLEGQPDTHRFLGPVLWSTPLDLPAWWNELPPERPLAYVTLGSSGQADVLPSVIDALGRLAIPAIVATAARTCRLTARGDVWIADYLPGEQAADRADLVICNGGSPTCYQALAAGVPIVGIPTNLDQYLNMSLIERAGAGRLVRAGQASAETLCAAIEYVLHRPMCREQACNLQRAVLRHPAGEVFASFLDSISVHA